MVSDFIDILNFPEKDQKQAARISILRILPYVGNLFALS